MPAPLTEPSEILKHFPWCFPGFTCTYRFVSITLCKNCQNTSMQTSMVASLPTCHILEKTLDIYPKQFDRCDKSSGLASQVTLMVENWSRQHHILAKWITRFCTSQMAVISYLLHKAIQLRQKTPLNNVLLYQQVTSVATEWRNSKKSLRVKHPLKCCEGIHQRKKFCCETAWN